MARVPGHILACMRHMRHHNAARACARLVRHAEPHVAACLTSACSPLGPCGSGLVELGAMPSARPAKPTRVCCTCGSSCIMGYMTRLSWCLLPGGCHSGVCRLRCMCAPHMAGLVPCSHPPSSHAAHCTASCAPLACARAVRVHSVTCAQQAAAIWSYVHTPLLPFLS